MTNYSPTLDRVFWALGDPTRFAIVESLARQSSSVSELAKPFNMALPTFLQHISVLEFCELITTKKVGRVRTCSLNNKKIEEVDAWLVTQQQIWAARFDALDKLLEEK